jgi:hypothetical protein
MVPVLILTPVLTPVLVLRLVIGPVLRPAAAAAPAQNRNTSMRYLAMPARSRVSAPAS